MYTDLALYIGGEWKNGGGRKGEDVVNPATEKPLGRLPHASTGDLDAALEAARKGFEVWRATNPYERAKVLRKARRMTDDDPDALVWDKLTRTTLDGIALPPLGTPALLEDLQTSGRPTRVGEWDVRAHVSDGIFLIHRPGQVGVSAAGGVSRDVRATRSWGERRGIDRLRQVR